jgi:type I restriction enzyme R subunit
MNEYSEASLIEQSAIELFEALGYDNQNCYHETFGKPGTLDRETPSDVVLIPSLKQSLIDPILQYLLKQSTLPLKN